MTTEITRYEPNDNLPTPDAAGTYIQGTRTNVLFTVALGDITNSSAQAILCPTDNKVDFMNSAGVSGAILREAGEEPFNEAARLIREASAEAEDGLPFGGALAVPSGRLVERGINHIIFTNIFHPPGSGEVLDAQGLSICVTSAALEANRMGADSLAIPAVSSGPFGLLELPDSIEGVMKGSKRYCDLPSTDVPTDILKKLSLVLFYRFSPGNVDAVMNMFSEAANRQESLPEPEVADSNSNSFNYMQFLWYQRWLERFLRTHRMNPATV